MKFAVFMMAEYVNMTTSSALLATLYFGGWQMFPGMHWLMDVSGLEGMAREWFRIALEATSFCLKVGFFMWLFVWVRWTLPRFRYDQLMALGWKILFPISLLNILVTGLLVWRGVI